MPALAGVAVQLCTVTLVVLSGEPVVSQPVSIQLLPAEGEVVVQDATGTLVVIEVPQVVVIQLLPVEALVALQLDTGTLLVTGLEQVVVIQLLPAEALVAGPDRLGVDPDDAGGR